MAEEIYDRNTNADYIPCMLKENLQPDSTIIESLEELRISVQSTKIEKPLTLADVNPKLASTCIEVMDLSRSAVVAKINSILDDVANNPGYSFKIPSRSPSNQLFVPELDRIVLKQKYLSRSFTSKVTLHKANITARILDLILQLCKADIHATKRDIFYMDENLFKKQQQSDDVLDDICCLLRCTRSSLNITASEKGLVVGHLTFVDDEHMTDCSKVGMCWNAIPPSMNRVRDIKSKALFILVVEKGATFYRLAEDKFYNRFPCIIITSKGQPDVASRMFLRKLKFELNLPVLALVDSDPFGLKILSVYGCGSQNMSYDSANLTTPDIKWLGIRPSDLEKYKVPKQCRLPMSDQDIKAGENLRNENFFKKHTAWLKELDLMMETKEKVEIQALCSFGLQYLTEVYLPMKLQEQDWL